MRKELVILSSLIVRTIIFVLISFAINLKLLKNAKTINSLKNLIFGLQITLIGIGSLYLYWNYTFYSVFWSVIMWFIPMYLITTGFTLSITGYLSKNN